MRGCLGNLLTMHVTDTPPTHLHTTFRLSLLIFAASPLGFTKLDYSILIATYANQLMCYVITAKRKKLHVAETPDTLV